MAILWRSTNKSKTLTYKGFVPIPKTIDEPTFAEKWKAWKLGQPKQFLRYTELQDLVMYCYQKNLMTTTVDLENIFHKEKIYTKVDAIKYIDEHTKDFMPIQEEYIPHNKDNNCCCNCKCKG